MDHEHVCKLIRDKTVANRRSIFREKPSGTDKKGKH
jgi:hypothetical protein